MGPKYTNKQRAILHQQVPSLFQQGKRSVEVSKISGVGIRTVNRWRYEVKNPDKHENHILGRPPLLSASQIQQLEIELLRGASVHGFKDDAWTCKKIHQLIWDLFGIQYTIGWINILIERMGLKQRLGIQCNRISITFWKVLMSKKSDDIIIDESEAGEN